uniref:NADH-ubiquinone oxidoreductase chain 2 n=1 Tax=Trigonopterus sp. AH-2016 TaxID=1903843 RepID=A0A343C450_9CUCU|nr:NADH dehydrogenase subunit 2 [Trigonopterus sp. AH-2016]
MTNFYKMLFLALLMASTLISISSVSWFTAWVGLEINLMALMPLMTNLKNKLSNESTIKYFIVQAMASSSLLFSVLILPEMKILSLSLSSFPSMMINSTLLLKMGAAPFHFWLPEIISGLNWNLIFIILTWQKIAPMILLSYLVKSSTFLSLIIIFSAIISGIQGMNQTCMRKIMAYSSINHTGWMLSSLLSSINVWFYYFTIYSFINFNIILVFNKYHIFYFNQLTKLLNFNKKLKLLFSMNFLSLGGLPPFLGFLPKWLTINFLVNKNFIALSLILILSTLVSLYFYTRITLSSITLTTNETTTYSMKKINHFHFFLNFATLISLALSLTLTNFL